MSNVDKDLDYMISPQEFYTLLSQKFEKDDPKEEAEIAKGEKGPHKFSRWWFQIFFHPYLGQMIQC